MQVECFTRITVAKDTNESKNGGSTKFSTVVERSGASCNSFYSNLCSVKSVKYRKLLFISQGSP